MSNGIRRVAFSPSVTCMTKTISDPPRSRSADAVDGWVYDEVARTYVLDGEMLERLSSLNPHSARSLVARLLEAEGRGFWEAEAGVVERLREIFNGLEDRIEGVA